MAAPVTATDCINEMIEIAAKCDAMARSIDHEFSLDERKLELMGFTVKEIDHIYEQVECRNGAPPGATLSPGRPFGGEGVETSNQATHRARTLPGERPSESQPIAESDQSAPK